MDNLQNSINLTGRVLMGAFWLFFGVTKLGAIGGMQAYMSAFGVPTFLVYPVIALEIIGGLLLLVGYQTRYVAIALAGFSVAAGVIFHSNVADQTQLILFGKNIAIAAGLLLIAANGAGAYSLDERGQTSPVRA